MSVRPRTAPSLGADVQHDQCNPRAGATSREFSTDHAESRTCPAVDADQHAEPAVAVPLEDV